jgi:hypothetical protein
MISNLSGDWLRIFIYEMFPTFTDKYKSDVISNNPSFRLKHTRVPDSSDRSDETWYPLMANYTIPDAQATGHVA